MPKSKKDYEGIEPCAVGSTVEVLINPHHAARPELLEVSVYISCANQLAKFQFLKTSKIRLF